MANKSRLTANIVSNTGISTLVDLNLTRVSISGVTTTGTLVGTAVSVTAGGLVAGIATVNNLNSTHINISGVTTVAAGSTSAPSITPTGDSNTGIFFPSADTIAFGEGGVESMRIDSNYNLLVGVKTATGTSSQPLQVVGGVYVSGNIGIGATDPIQKLTVNGGIRSVVGSQGDITISHANLITSVITANGVDLSVGTANTEAIRVSTSGNVGIGTSNLGSISASVSSVTIGSKSTVTSGGIVYQTTGGVNRAYHYYDDNRLIHQSTGRHAFLPGGSTVRMLINESGDTTIGTGSTTADSYKFPLTVSTNDPTSPTDGGFGGLFSYNGGTFHTVHIGGGVDNDTTSACTLMISCSATPAPFGGLVVVGGNNTSATNQRVSLYLVKGEVKTTAGTAAAQNTTVTAVAGDTGSTSLSISSSSLDSGATCAVKMSFNSGGSTNQNFGFVVMGSYSIIKKSVREAG